MMDWESILKGNGFVRWSYGGMAGWHRQTAFVKDCLVGEIARYYADDYIVTNHHDDSSVEWLKSNWQRKEDVIKHRFLLLESKRSKLITKPFWLGLGGWLEVLQYQVGDREKRFEDLIFFVEKNDTEKVL